jgi:hypothetical protein
MDWASWGVLIILSLSSGIVGALLYSRRATILHAASARRARLWELVRGLRRRRGRLKVVALARPRAINEDTVVLIPDGRPWPLGPALQLLELAWRWQVVHGNNLPLRARQGEGAYVWRPPLPTRATNEPHADAERS